MKLELLLNNLETIQVVGAPEGKEITSITANSKDAVSGSLFIAISGFKRDGHSYLQDVINKGAAAVMIEKDDLPDEIFKHACTVKILVKNSRKAMAQIADAFYDSPSKKLKLIGITGTKGKTTTSYYLRSIVSSFGYKCGLLGTIANYIGNEQIKANLTTPDSIELNMLLDRMVEAGCTHCIMEVSSHALELFRVHALEFDAAIFMNITSDHMDFHADFDSYLLAKKILFDGLNSNAVAIINSDDIHSKDIVKNCSAKIKTFGSTSNSDYKISDINYSLKGTKFHLSLSDSQISLSTKLIGHFNAYNASAAFASAIELGMEPLNVAEAIRNTPQVPGRFEVISKGSKSVIVDYSHTADSLKQALIAIQTITNGERPIHTVFGCGGDRDKTKRPVMGKIAEELSDTIYITSDNPRTENPVTIIEEILTGVKDKSANVIENRDEAIKTAIQRSEDNAVILIAGKGHESYQEINGVRNYFSDKATAEKYLNE
ncbi:MAG: UDP-N-acetylmuramoyl-L-alanyl-D-glutamate--2,6-diaminopimelate ligase [Bacteroidota bacterium]